MAKETNTEFVSGTIRYYCVKCGETHFTKECAYDNKKDTKVEDVKKG
jgi:hypothetical protein